MAAEAEVAEAIVYLIRLLGGARFLSPLERIFPAVAPLTDTDALQKLEDAAKTKSKVKPEDNKHVVKVNDAIAAVEKTFRDGAFLLAVMKGLVTSLIGGQSIPAGLVDQIAQAIRDKALQQMNPERARQTPGRTRR